MFTNDRVVAILREQDARAIRIEAALNALLARTSTPVPVVEIPAESPVIVAATAEKAPKVTLRCAGGVSKACEREFGNAANLAQHNAWAHKA